MCTRAIATRLTHTYLSTHDNQWWSTIAAAKLPNFQHGRVLFPFPLLKLVPYRANLYRRTQARSWGCNVTTEWLWDRMVDSHMEGGMPACLLPYPSVSLSVHL